MPEITPTTTVPITIRLPPEIGMPLIVAATAGGRTIQAEILQRLGKSLKVKIETRGKGRPKGLLLRRDEEVAAEHAAADARCGRDWLTGGCTCGACRIVRKRKSGK